MEPSEILYLLADEETRARARELIGSERHAILLAKAALGDTGELPDVEVAAKLLKLTADGARKRVKKTGDKTRQ